MSKYILWDLDGTLVESESAAFKFDVYCHACAKVNLTFDLELQDFVGHEGKTMFPLLYERGNLTGTEDYDTLYGRWYEEAMTYLLSNAGNIEARGNICEIWKKCSEKGIKHALVTNNREDIATAYLKKIGLLPACEILICAENVCLPKPSPIPYLTALQKLSISNKDCLAVEDSTTGITSATEADLYTIAWVRDKNNPKFSAADWVTDEIDETFLMQKLTEVRHTKSQPGF